MKDMTRIRIGDTVQYKKALYEVIAINGRFVRLGKTYLGDSRGDWVMAEDVKKMFDKEEFSDPYPEE